MKELNNSIPFDKDFDLLIKELIERNEFECTAYMGCIGLGCPINT